MPIIESAKKAIRQSARKRVYNIRRKNKIKDLLKQWKSLIEAKKTEEAKKLLPLIYKALDKAAKSKTIKKNTASRRKSRIAKATNRQ